MDIILETERLIIRNWIPEQDVQQVFTMYNHPEVIHFLGSGARPPSIDFQLQKLRAEKTQTEKTGLGSWAIIKKKYTSSRRYYYIRTNTKC